jgi:hypothetical protein
MKFKVYQTRISMTLLTILSTTLLGFFTQTITILDNVNYFLSAFTYFIVSYFLWIALYNTDKIVKSVVELTILIVFGFGGILATLGCIFILRFSIEMTPFQNFWLADNLIYKEWNLGSGPDPDKRLKCIEIYKTNSLFPIIATRIKDKKYDNWEGNLSPLLEARYNAMTKKLYLSNSIQEFPFSYKHWNSE